MDIDRKFYIDEFKSDECQCGAAKQPRRAFCYRCYSSLPADMAKALYKPFGSGYEGAYDEALEWLT